MTKAKESKEKIEDLEMMTALNRRPSTSVVTLDGQPPAADFADCISNQHTAQRRRGHHHSQHSLVRTLIVIDLNKRDDAGRTTACSVLR